MSTAETHWSECETKLFNQSEKCSSVSYTTQQNRHHCYVTGMYCAHMHVRKVLSFVYNIIVLIWFAFILVFLLIRITTLCEVFYSEK